MKEWILAHRKPLVYILLLLKILGTLCIIIGFGFSWFDVGNNKCPSKSDCTGEIVQEEKPCTVTDTCKGKYICPNICVSCLKRYKINN